MSNILHIKDAYFELRTNSNEESYKRWHWIMNRCYSNAIHELQPEYKECTV